jgi:hypothetical protein
MREIDRLHRLRIDARPDDMGVLATVFLVYDDGARLALQAERAFRPVGSRNQIIKGWLRIPGRVEAQRKHRLAAARAFGDGAGLDHRPPEVSGNEAAHLMQRDMIVFPVIEKMRGELAQARRAATP